MNSEQIKESLRRVLQIIEQSNVRELSDIERDIALAALRDAYAWLRFESVSVDAVSIAAPAMSQDAEEECAEPDEPEIEIEIITHDEEDVEPSEAYMEPQLQSVNVEPSSHAVQDVAEEPTPQKSVSTEELNELRPSSRSSILSLYDDEPKVAAEPSMSCGAISGEEQVIGEIFRCESPAVGDSISRPKSMSESAPVVSLSTAIGVADRYMFVKELFNDDAAAYEAAIAHLDNMPSLDDCMIYIAENYSWRSGSDAARQLVELLQRKYQR